MDKNKSRNLEPGKRMLAVLFAVFLASTMVLPAGVMSGQVTENVPDAPGPSPVPMSGGGGDDDIQTITLQPNATVGKDSWLWEDNDGVNPNNNYSNSGGDIGMPVGTWDPTDTLRGLIQFDLPTNPVTIDHATLKLYTYEITNAAYGVNISAYPLNVPWVEDEVTWANRSAGIPWTIPGGDYDASMSANRNFSQIDTWFELNITEIVNAWITGAMPNNGLLLIGTNLSTVNNRIRMYSSDYTANTNLTPKLILTYAAVIDPTVPAQSMSEDDPTLNVDLSGRGHGSIVNQAGPCTLTTGYPFVGGAQLHYQSVYTPAQVGAEGVIKRISINRSSMAVGNYSNFKIFLAHTDLADLTNTFASNYNGYQVEVFSEANFEANSSNGDTWVHFDLNDNFTYDSQHNLLVDIQWNGRGGSFVTSYVTNDVGVKRIYSTTGAATGTTNQFRPAFRFTTDVVDNGVIDNGTAGNFWPFAPEDQPELRCQLLYNYSLINQSGIIDKISFQAWQTSPDWAVVENISIRLAHSQNDTLGNVFEAHRSSPWVEVLNELAYNVSTVGRPEWIELDVNNLFNYNGVDNLLIDIRWRGGYGSDPQGVNLVQGTGLGYNSRLAEANYSAITGTDLGTTFYNLQTIFQESVNLSWSASSSDPALFAAGVTGRTLSITPVADAFGAGTLTLTLTNSNGEGVSQLIPVNINAVNDAPVLSGVPTDIHCIEDVDYVLNVTTYASDIDNPFSELTFSTDSAYAFTDGAVITFNYPEGITSEYVNITVRDSGGLTDTVMVLVTITPVNDLPQLTGFVDTLICEATIAKTYTVHPVDEETVTGQLLIYTSSIYATVTNHAIFFLYPKGIGSESVTIYLVDEDMYGSQNNISYVLAVTINDHPEVTAHSPNGTGVAVTTTIEVTFDMAMNRTTAETAFSLTYGTTELNGTFSWNAGSTIVTFTPSSVLTNGVYDVSVGTGASSAAGHNMFAAYSWNFTAALGSYDGDGDGMPDQYELDNGLDPATDDSAGDKDGDGMPNLWEYTYDLNPSVNDAALDPDDDGFSNLEEYEAETSPTDPNDKPPTSLPWMLIILILLIVVVLVIVGLLMKNRGKGSNVADQPYEGPPADEPYEGPPADQPYESPPADQPYIDETPEVIELVQEDVPPPPPPPAD